MSDSQAYLILQSGEADGVQEWSLEEGVTHIGRWEGNDVVLPNREVSRKHAQIRADGAAFILADLGSKNGTQVNGLRVEGAQPLKDGDELVIAPCYQLRFVDNEATAAVYRRPRGIRIDALSRQASVAGSRLDPALAPNQFALLQLLMRERGRVYSRDEIAQACYPEAAGDVSDQAIDGLVRRLRARLAEADPESEYIVAVRGHGFQLKP